MKMRFLLAAAVCACLSAVRPSAADTYGLVVGIDDYANLPKLGGAVNDARDIEAALRQAGARKIHTFIDREATRDAILGAWKDIVSQARAGDTVVFSYAGHGGQEPERIPGSEKDGRDEVFQLAGFSTAPGGNRERIIDDEINAMFAAARHLKIVFVADSCHSGTMTRSFDPRAGALKTRLGGYGEIVDDGLPPPDPDAAQIDPELLDNVIFFGAVQDHELALELSIDGQSRGALSWAFARAIRGGADGDGDSVVNTRELERYLVENVRSVSEGRQFPQMAPRGRPTEIALRIEVGTPPQSPEQVGLHIVGVRDPSGLVGALQDVRPARAGKADLVWDRPSGEIVNATGDIVARIGPNAGPAAVQPIVDKWLLLRMVQDLGASRPLDLRLWPDHGVHQSGAHVAIEMRNHTNDNLTFFNLGVDGTVQFLIPWPSSGNPIYHGRVRPGEAFRFPFCVSAPFGADHAIALVTPDGTARLNRRLRELDGSKNARTLRKELRSLLQGVRAQVGTIGLFTTRGGNRSC